MPTRRLAMRQLATPLKLMQGTLCYGSYATTRSMHAKDKNEPPYLIEVWLGYRSGRLYLAEQFHDGKISEKDFRTKLALIGKQAFDEAERRRQAHSGH